MNNEEFYKNIALKALNYLNEHYQNFTTRARFPELILSITEEGEIKEIERKLIINEKTWYKTANGEDAYILGKWPYYNSAIWKGYVVPSSGENWFRAWNENGKCGGYSKNSNHSIIAECTPEEAQEIESKLIEKYEGNR